MTSHVAVYPGTFDPLTKGHQEIVKRAHHLFGQVIVAVADSARKTPFLTLEERIALAKQVFAEYPGIKVSPLCGLLVDFAVAHKATCIVRGLRDGADFNYELQLAGMNQQLNPAIETLFLAASGVTAPISGTLVREIYHLGGDISLFVPDVVAQYLKRKS